MNEVLSRIEKLTTSGQAGVLVTVVENAGAAPGKVSFKMLVMPDGKTHGTVGGGSLETVIEPFQKQLVVVSDPGILIDIDTPEDYNRKEH